jgi:hypothetical protein
MSSSEEALIELFVVSGVQLKEAKSFFVLCSTLLLDSLCCSDSIVLGSIFDGD